MLILAANFQLLFTTGVHFLLTVVKSKEFKVNGSGGGGVHFRSASFP